MRVHIFERTSRGDAGCRRRVAEYRWIPRGDSHWRAVIQLPTTTNNIREQLGRRL